MISSVTWKAMRWAESLQETLSQNFRLGKKLQAAAKSDPFELT